MRSHSSRTVWELRGLIEDVRCLALSKDAKHLLIIERAGERLLEEEHASYRRLMARARELRSSLVRVGFEPLSTDASTTSPLNSLLLTFVRLGRAPLCAAGPRPS